MAAPEGPSLGAREGADDRRSKWFPQTRKPEQLEEPPGWKEAPSWEWEQSSEEHEGSLVDVCDAPAFAQDPSPLRSPAQKGKARSSQVIRAPATVTAHARSGLSSAVVHAMK